MCKEKNYVIEDEFNYKGFKCLCKFMNGGYRTGYVDIDTSKYPNLDLDTLENDMYNANNSIKEITFSEFINDNTYRIGFDYAHGNDLFDTVLLSKYFNTDQEVIEKIEMLNKLTLIRNPKNHPKTLEDCKNDCMNYCDTLEKIL